MKVNLSILLITAIMVGCNHNMHPLNISQKAQIASPVLASVSTAPSFDPNKYNTAFYPTILDAAKGIANPFLLQQGFFKLSGLTVNDTNLLYNGNTFHVSQQYWNPAKDPSKAFHDYTVKADNYEKYNLHNISNIWPRSCPNALYDSATKTFNATVDCVGFGSRLLAAVGDGSANNNAYLELLNTLKQSHTTISSSKGYVSTAYSFSVALPTLPTDAKKGWSYVAGNIDFTAIDEYNHTKNAKVNGYNGLKKGGFAKSLPGDILVFGNGPGTKYNGHFMVIDHAPKLLDADGLRYYYPNASTAEITKVLDLYNMYAVNVIDDSGLEAHFDDSRHQTSGIGHGTVLISTTKTDDMPTGIVTKAKTKDTSINIRLVSENKSTSMFALSVGRYK